MVRLGRGVRCVRKGSMRGSMCFAGFLPYLPVLSVYLTHILREYVSATIRSDNFPLPSHPGQQRVSGIAAAKLDGSLDFRNGQSGRAGFLQRNQNASPLLRTLDVSRIAKDRPAAGLSAELEPEVMVFDIAASSN